MKKTVLLLLVCSILFSLCGCSALYGTGAGDNSKNKNTEVTVHYYETVTRIYELKDKLKVECEHLAPSGQRIVGLFDEYGIQYADYSLIINLNKNSIPTDLYARYEKVDISYLNKDPFLALDEKPTKVSFYKSNTLSWIFDVSEYPEDENMISACMCNPYADLIIKVSFYGKGNTSHENQFTTNLKVADETIGKLQVENLGENYTLYTYTGTIKAKQLINSNYEVKVYYGAKYGYEEYTIKNIKVDFSFNFE